MKSEKAKSLLRHWFSDGVMNGKPYPQRSVFTRGRGAKIPGLSTLQRLGFVISQPDETLNRRGWRHDITPAGIAALEKGK